ncbi:hypothetical protein [Paraburkholderia fungorum]
MARADAYFAGKRLPEAIDAYKEVLALEPQHVNALHRAGLASFLDNQMVQAGEFLSRALLVAPERADIWEQRGLLAALAEDWIAAEAFYHRALSLTGSTATLHRNLGDCLRSSLRLAEAKAHYIKALELEPGLHHAARALAEICTELGQFADAANYWTRAWALDSTSLADGLALILALAKIGRRSDIEPVVEAMRCSFASNADALKELSYTLNCARCFSEAISIAKQGLAADPKNEQLHLNAMYGFDALVDLPGLQSQCIEAVRNLPDNALMQYVLATLELKFGEFEQGWKRWKWHKRTPYFRDPVRPDFPEWNGEAVAGCKFLLVKELGLGDQIQFLRMAHWLHRQGATVDVWVDAPLNEVARSASGVHAVWTDLPPGPYDYFCHMMRMPEYMKLALPMLPLAMPYIAATPEKIHRWQAYLDDGARDKLCAKNRRVGLVWAGDPNHPFDHRRSVKLDMLRPLLGQPGVTWYSVQKGYLERESEDLANEFDLHTLGPDINDFADTLAILQTLDLLITVDTSVAHLAGAAGLPVWVLLPAHSDWRWMLDRADSPWYPSMRLFRQRKLGEWGPVVEEVRQALGAWCDTSAIQA